MISDFFGGLAPRADENNLHALRRKELAESIALQFSEASNGIILLFAAFEHGAERFRQDKTFYYYTNIDEPGVALVIDYDKKSTLYIPNCFEKRAQWMMLSAGLINRDAKALRVDAVELLGEECQGYELNPYFSAHEYIHLITLIKSVIARNGSIFTTVPQNGHEYLHTRFTLDHLEKFIPGLHKSLVDISAIVANSRRRKDVSEVEHIYRAVEITELAHEGAVDMLKHGVQESEVQAALEYMMISSHARPAFPSIVASGKNGTILHYNTNNGMLKNGDLVLIDIGAEFNNYCADLTRTYPVSGIFTKRQKELYTIVLETQAYIASCAKPGVWLKNKDNVEKSLHHLAVKFLTQCGYDKYFPHDIGHFLGLDVHDVGDYTMPLQEGDVITIEPGIYIPEESIGIRIEDNYWITKDGALCLSENLPKEIADIESIVQNALNGISNDETDEDDFDDDEDDEDIFS
ncbi:MAG TPA: aminopeptidase P N-terminal domain-containing protein [Candidatus Babeliales bacterium]|nr:aminopeptidase P N-terminal domain-containing protein [Candidatus Babeliales bacterium]